MNIHTLSRISAAIAVLMLINAPAGRANLVTAESSDTTVETRWIAIESGNITVDTRDGVTLTLNATHGSVPGAGLYDPNTQVQLTATPDPGYLFSAWSGDATGSTNPLSVTMDSNKTISATFVEDTRDSDGDGLTNYQEAVVYGTNPQVADTDGDGFPDGYEVSVGTNPNSATSTPELQMEIYTAVELRFGAALGQSYRIESSTDMQNWTQVEAGIPGTGATVTRFYSIQGLPKRFFRAGRE